MICFKVSKPSSEQSAIKTRDLNSWLPLSPTAHSSRFINHFVSQQANQEMCQSIDDTNVKLSVKF